MQTIKHLVSVVAFTVIVASARGDEPHLDLIRGLRAQGEPGLAMEYIQTKLANPPDSIKGILPLEIARTRVELALQESEEGKRLAMLATARAEFETFLKANPTHPLAPQASFEIARLISSQGKEHLNRSRKQSEDAGSVKKSLELAVPLFQDVATKLQEAGKLIKSQLDKIPNPATPEEKATVRELQQAFLQSQLEEGINLFQLSQAYGADNTKRLDSLDKCLKVLGKLSAVDLKNPTCWVARAWLGRCYTDMQEFPKAKDAFEQIRLEKGAYMDAAKRLAGYFELLMLNSEGATKGPKLEQDATRWINTYRSYLNAPEGWGVRYFLAANLESQAEAGITRDPKTGRPKSVTADSESKLMRAERLLRDLADTENDYTERATNKRMKIILALAIRQAADRDVTKLKTFEKCFLIGLLEMAELNEKTREIYKKNSDKLSEDLEKVRKEQYQKVLAAVDRALSLATDKDPKKEVLDARDIQAFANLTLGHNKKAAEQAEKLALELTRSSRGARAALYALQAHRNTLTDLQANGDVDEKAAQIKKATDEIRRIATFMEATWPNDTPTDFARHQLGALLARDGDYLDALKTFERVTPTYGALAFVRNEQAIACYNLQRMKEDPKTITPAVKQAWFTKITGELERMPDLAQGAEPEAAGAYCRAKLQLANLYRLQAKDYVKVETLAKAMMAKLKDYVSLTPQTQTELSNSARVLQLAGLYGQVAGKLKVNDSDGAQALYQPLVDDVKKNGVPEGDDAIHVREAIGSVLQLALRCSVQKGEIERAQDLLKLLEKASVGQAQSASGPLVQVLREVRSQIDEMKKTNPDRLKDTVEKFSSFLEDLAKQPNNSTEVKIFLAQGFTALDRPARAMDLLRSVTPPAPAKAGATDDEKTQAETAQKTYNYVQLLKARTLRAAALELPAADKKNRDKLFAEAKTLIDAMVGTPTAKGWAFNSLEVRREYMFLLEDQGRYADAMAAWRANQKPFQSKLKIPATNAEEQRIRTVVYEYHFYILRCVYLSKARNPALAKDAAKKETEYRKVAANIVKVEKDPQTSDFGGDEVKKLYKELLDGDELLRKSYSAEGGVVLVSGGASAGGGSQ